MLKGEKVTLAPLRAEDVEQLYRWINDRPEVLAAAAYKPVHEAAHRSWVDSVVRRDDTAIFGIRTSADDRLIGYVQLVDIDSRTRSAELRIKIGDPEKRAQALGPEAGGLALRHGFEDLNLRRIWAHVFATNEPVRRAAAGIGFREEGVLREAAYVGGEYVDVIVIGLLRDEFRPPASITARK